MENKSYRDNRYVKRWACAKKAFDYLGGKCKKCGEKHFAALSFHHRDPSQKSHDVSRLIQKVVNWEVIKEEIDKCDLLCENCHRKLHFDQERFDKNFDRIVNKASGVRFEKDIKMNRWNDEDVAKLVVMYNQEKSIHEISHELNRVESAIRRKIKELIVESVLQKREFSIRKPDLPVTDQLCDLVVKLNQEFISAFEISKQTGLSITRVYNIIRRKKNV